MQHAPGVLHGAGGGDDVRQRWFRRARIDGADEHVALGQCHRRSAAPGERIQHQPGDTLSGFVHVDVRILAIADQEGSRLQHARGDVAVQVERHADRQRGWKDGAHALDDLALGVGIVLDQHCAV